MFKKKTHKDGNEAPKKVFAFERLYTYGLWLLSRRDYTTYEMTQKMKNYQPDEKIIQDAIDKLTSLGYINDERRASSIVSAYIKKESAYKIKRRLSEKGLSKDIIEDTLQNYIDENEDVELNTAKKLLLKKFKTYNPELKQKYCSYLVGRGYSWDLISKAIENLKKDSENKEE